MQILQVTFIGVTEELAPGTYKVTLDSVTIDKEGLIGITLRAPADCPTCGHASCSNRRVGSTGLCSICHPKGPCT